MNKILVANTDYAKCLLYQEELTFKGYEVITASDCEGLMETITQHNPDLIVLQIKMGEVKGPDIVQEIRDASYDMPVILSTDYLPLNTIQNLLQVIEKSHEICLPELG